MPREKLKEIKEMLGAVLEQLIKQGCTDFIAGGALGFDTLAAEAVIGARNKNPHIRLALMLPCKDQHTRWPVYDRMHYEYILDAADEVIYVCEKYVTGCMHLRNKRMIDGADICVAYFENKKGGTEYTLKYAEERNCPVINIAQML